MPRHVPRDDQGFGSDSFMDIVANVVGILIILLILVGLRVRNAPSDDGAAPLAELTALRGDEQALTGAARQRRAAAEALAREVAGRASENSRLAALLAERESARLAARDAAASERSGLEQHVAEAASFLDRLEIDAADARSATPSAERIDSYPTPLAQLVLGDEAHFQLRGGRIAFIPLEDLLKELRSDARQQMTWKLRDLPESTETVGPVGGFRLRYTMKKFDVALGEVNGRRQAGSYAELTEWTLIPVSAEMGETLEEALAEGSKFRQAVARLRPLDATVTVWTYADSFAEFRALKKELYAQGFATACRPLPNGHPISGSPDGSKSAAQ